MIELLVSILIFSIGILGLAYLQFMSLRANNMAHMRALASTIAYVMADGMRANPVGALAGEYNGSPSASEVNCVGSDHTCPPAQMAAYDKNSWLSAIQALPRGSGVVTSLGSGQYAITVRWDQDRTGASDINCPPLSADDLRCYQLDITL
jgi:type IV pilus assembly protein PilV